MCAAIVFDNVTIQYPIYNSRAMSLRNQLVRFGTGGRIESEAGRIHVVTAVQNATFSFKDGDFVGVVGPNGAGKSTLLRAMAGVYAPVTGSVRREGRVATLFEIGTGMDPELSGYENITRMSMLLGMNKAAIKANIADIEDFTELNGFLSLPVRTYSAGMATRLIFGVATSVRPEILLVDEVFGTGDASFQAKAKERMEKLVRSVGIFVIASHSNQMVSEYCNRFLALDKGVVREITRNELVTSGN